MEDCEQLIHPSSKFLKLAFIVILLNLKCLHGWSDKAFTSLLQLLLEVFHDIKILASYYEAKKTIQDLELDYEKMDACKNDCILYWKVYA